MILGTFLLVFAGFVVIAILSPETILPIFSMNELNESENFWEPIETEEIGEPERMPPILLNLLPTVTQTEFTPELVTVSETPTAHPTTNTYTPIPSAAVSTDSPVPTAVSTGTPSPTASATSTETPTPAGTPTSVYAALFRTSYIPTAISFVAEGYLNLTFRYSGMFASAVELGESYSGAELGILEFEEDSLGLLCETYFNNCETPLYTVNAVDFRDWGAMVYLTVNTGLRPQDIGVALMLNTDRRSLRLGGVLLNNRMFAPPKTGPLADLFNSLASKGNAALQLLTLQAEGNILHFQEMWFDNHHLVVVLQ